MIQISAFIITKNEEKLIARAINSVKAIAREVIVVDSGSVDKTVEIAKSLGAKVVHNDWQGYVLQKSFAESLCKNDWVLNIDADEELTKELQDEILYIFSGGLYKKYLAYEIDFIILHRKDNHPRYLAPSNKFIRIYNKDYCSFSNTVGATTKDVASFNSNIDGRGRTYKLNGVAYHRSGTSIDQLVAKANFYSGEQAKDIEKSGRVISAWRVAFEFPFCFLKAYLKRRYFVFGFDGFVDSVIFAFARFLRMAKARELQLYSSNLDKDKLQPTKITNGEQ